jgi:excisionase family DNA binding protein
MKQQLYTVDQVAELLGLQARTVRNYIRDGRLQAVRIGKQYRIARTDVEALTGQPVAGTAPATASRHRRVEVSSIVQIDAIDPELAGRIQTHLTAATNSRGMDEPLRVQTIYDEERARLKIIVLGDTGTTIALLRLISAFTEGEH